MAELVLTAGPYELDEEGHLRIKDGKLLLERPFWLSWFEHEDAHFSLITPWWCSGYRDTPHGKQDLLCAAVMAHTEEHAVSQIIDAHDIADVELEFAFIEDRPLGWTPFHETGLPRSNWMRWEQKPH